jgi:hypothetical protein
MKVNIKGNTITSAAYEHFEGKLPMLIINTKDRWVHWNCTFSDAASIKFEYKHKSYVEIIAENDSEVEVLSRIRFENHCKDQKLILFVSDDLM